MLISSLLQRREESQWSTYPASFREIGHTQGEMTKGQGQWGSVDTHRGGAERKEEGSREGQRDSGDSKANSRASWKAASLAFAKGEGRGPKQRAPVSRLA